MIRMMKSRWMRWGHEACMREKRNAYKVLVGKPEGKRPPGRQRHIRWIFEKQNGVVWAGLIWLRIGTSGGLL
jgi:hypothetical protein